ADIHLGLIEEFHRMLPGPAGSGLTLRTGMRDLAAGCKKRRGRGRLTSGGAPGERGRDAMRGRAPALQARPAAPVQRETLDREGAAAGDTHHAGAAELEPTLFDHAP